MHIIANTTNAQHLTTGRVDERPDILMQARQMLVLYLWTSRFYMEDDVKIYLT